jgi:hypothetical protein
MNDFIAGPASGTNEDGTGPWGGGTPPPVLLAALGAALLIAVTLVAFLVGGGGGGSNGAPVPAGAAGVDDPGQGTPAPVEKRVLLSLSVEGGGSGSVLISPRGVSCSETCEKEFVTGTRVTVTADAANGSRFEGWGESCSGVARCSFFMDRERSLTATFEATSATPQCTDGRDNDGDGLIDDADPGCKADGTEAPDNSAPPVPVGDCHDGRDNDGDGLIDSGQDPGCTDGTEADSGPTTPPPATTPVPPPPPPPTTTQPTPPAPGATTTSECHDGIDNDGDGRIDRPSDPGCDADGTEAGG